METTNQKERATANFFDRLDGSPSKFDAPITPKEARGFIDNYKKFLEDLKIDPTKQTYAVSFKGKELKDWLGALKNTDELRIFFGVYPADRDKRGRLTIVLWPYKDGAPSKKVDKEDEEEYPYNIGSLHP